MCNQLVRERELVDVLRERLPYDGPHGPKAVSEAAEGVQYLVRYLSNATAPWNLQQTLADAETTHHVLDNVAAAVHDGHQLMAHLARMLAWHADDPNIYDDRRDRPGSQTASEAAVQVADARRAMRELAAVLDRLGQLTAHLHNEEGAWQRNVRQPPAC